MKFRELIRLKRHVNVHNKKKPKKEKKSIVDFEGPRFDQVMQLIESNAWLVPLVMGLSLDIAGVIILAGPLLNFNHQQANAISNSVDNNYKKMIYDKKERDKLDPNNIKSDDTFYYSQDIDYRFANLTYQLSRNQLNDVRREFYNFKNSRIALTILVTGFTLQIIGNIIQSLS